MPEYHFQFTTLAVQDMEQSLSYIRDVLDNPIAACNLTDEIQRSIQKLCRFPFAYPDCTAFLIQDRNIRHINIRHYILIYEIDSAHQTLHILRFLYSGRDISTLSVRDNEPT